MEELKRRKTDSQVYFSDLRDLSGWLNRAMLGVIAYFLININGDFRLLQKAVTQLTLEAAKRDEKMKNIIITQGRFERNFEQIRDSK